MDINKWLMKELTDKRLEKLAKCLVLVFIMVLSIFVLSRKIPETKMIQNTIVSIDESNKTVMEFSGATIATSLAISALPDDFASPLAGTLADMNQYFLFIFAVLFVEKLIVIEGVELSFVYIIPAACVLYMLFVWFRKEVFKSFATKLLVLGLAIIVVIPFSTHFTEKVCAEYMGYVDETIAEANAGAEKVNEVMVSGEEEETIFDKLSEAFKTAIQGMSDLLAYFKNMVKKCINSIAIMIVTTFVLPLLVLFLFRWLLNELFAWNLAKPQVTIRLPKGKKTDEEMGLRLEDRGEES